VRTGTLKQLPALAARFLREPKTEN
jgi:hypothetical protein